MNKKILVGSIIVILVLFVIVLIFKLNSNRKSFENYIMTENDIQIDTSYSDTQTKILKSILESNFSILEQYDISIEDLSELQYTYVETENKYTYILYKNSKFYSIIVWADNNVVEVLE